MWPLLAGLGAVALLTKLFSDDSDSKDKNIKKSLFISFAKKDEEFRDHLVAQAKRERSPFSFIDMSVKEPWKEEIWQKKCRSKIKSCDGMIVLLSNNTYHSKGARWEIKCAREEKIPVVGMHIRKNEKGAIPPELKGKKVITWTWENLGETIKKL